jgi:hypothetical protein
MDFLQFLRNCYGLLVSLYPKTYREEYGDELRDVFELSLNDASRTGKFEVASIALRELISLPQAILNEHLRKRRRSRMARKFSDYFNFDHGSRREFVSSLYPFMLLGVILPLMNLLTRSGLLVSQSTLVNGIGVFLVAITGILLLLGVVTGLKRWFLPYAGFFFSLVSVYGFSLLLDRWNLIPFQFLYSRSWLLGQVAYQGFLWGGLTLMTILLVAAIILVPPLHRFKNDWTLLVFFLYGATPFALVLTFDDYVNDELWVVVASLVLMLGIWLYTHTIDPRRQFWILFGGMTVSLLLAAVGKAIIYQYFWEGVRHFKWQTETMSTITMWMWLALTMLIPLLIKLSPQANNRLQNTDAAAM